MNLAELGDMLPFDTTRRLYHLDAEGLLGELLVEAWALREALSEPWTMEITALSRRHDLDLDAMLAQRCTLVTTLADGSALRRSGIVTDAAAHDADGGFTRYALSIRPWIALLAHSMRSQVWQERSVVEIVDAIFGDYRAHAAWRWSEDVAVHLQRSAFGSVRDYCVQYRESDLAFVQRLLAEEGLCWRIEPDEAAPLGHAVVLFADSASAQNCPPDTASASAGSIRFHRDAAVEEQDTIQAFGARRSLQPAIVTTLGWDDQAKRAIAATLPSEFTQTGAASQQLLDALESYQPTGRYADAGRAQRAAELLQQTFEARHKTWLGRGTVRSFSAGHRFTLSGSPLDARAAFAGDAEVPEFLLTDVIHAGLNNLPKELSRQLASADVLPDWIGAPLREQAERSGYANGFTALRAGVPWRTWRWDDHGALLNPRPTAAGFQSATVVGPDGATDGPPEIHTDRLGRVRIRFAWQGVGTVSAHTARASAWVRVVQRWAGSGHGVQWIPRIGQEVLVGFLEDDIDRPLVQGVLHTGRGEAGAPATPGGRTAATDTGAFARSSDHAPSAQGNLASGHGPAWHGAAPGPAGEGAAAQNNAAALSGWKTQEFGGSGFNQLVFDDSDGQVRAQLATTQFATHLSIGHLIHQADNHRGSLRGLGFELRTDAWGSLRGARGVLLSTYGALGHEPAGDNAAGLALMGQLKTLGQTFSDAARTHEATALAAHIGSTQANQSALSDTQPPLQAMHTALKGMVDAGAFEAAQGDAAAKNTRVDEDKLPHTADPVVALSARAGLGVVAGQDLQLTAGETITLAAGQDMNQAVGGAMRIHTGQGIGVLAGAVGPGDQAAGTGLTLIAGSGDIDLQAQADALQIAARDPIDIASESAHVDWAAAKKITLATAGGASIVLEGGNITVQCPGTITVRASVKSFTGPEKTDYPLPSLPRQVCVACLLSARKAGARIAIA